jgi:hypothetical protein
VNRMIKNVFVFMTYSLSNTTPSIEGQLGDS